MLTSPMRPIDLIRLVLILIALAGAIAATRSATDTPGAPESGSGFTAAKLATATRSMVATPNPHATRAAVEILRAGGSAADAAIATQFVLTLVEPQATGIGGGGFALHWTAGNRSLDTYDGRETAPAAAKPDRFMEGGRPMPYAMAVRSGLSVGTPGLVRLMEMLHRAHGRLPWPTLIAPALRLAEDGFDVSPRLHTLLARTGASSFPQPARSYFFDAAGRAWPVGHRLKNPALTATLSAIARNGADAFYRGAIAEDIVAAVARAPHRAGDLTAQDLAAYAVEHRPPLCIDYRAHRVCGMGPPSSGGYAVAQSLKLIEPFGLGAAPDRAMNPLAVHLIAEATRLAFADRDFYLGDPSMVAEPRGLLDHGYLDARRSLLDRFRRAPATYPGTAPANAKTALGDDATHEQAGTSHVSIVDAAGNAIALTTTIESSFGSRLMAGGFLLNNELTDFSMRPRDASGRPIANAVGPGKRPRSSMAPTIALYPDGSLAHVVGSTGGSAIIPYVVQTLVALIDWQLDPQSAAALAHFVGRGPRLELESDRRALGVALRLAPFGHRFAFGPQTSGTHIVSVRGGMLQGGVDPRKEGVALGD